MEGDMPTNAGTRGVDPEHTLGGHQEVGVTAPTDALDFPTAVGDNQDRALRALQVAAITGFMEKVGSTQTSCLSLCNTCREHVPAEILRIREGVPSSLLAIVCPGVQPAETERSSRVLPPRRVLKVHWTFDDSLTDGRSAKKEDEHEEDSARQRRSVDDLETDHAAYLNVDVSNVRWLEGTRGIDICSFNRRIDTVTFPVCLELLSFGHPPSTLPMVPRVPDIFNMPLDGVTFPAGLREIFLGDSFNQPIEGVAWPGGLELLSMPGFNQSIRDVHWPPGLKILEFVSPTTIKLWESGGLIDMLDGFDPDVFLLNGRSTIDSPGHGKFNQPLGTTLPQSLETLWLSNDFRQPLDSVAWPSGMVTLGLAFDLHHYSFAGSITWPLILQELFTVNRPIEGMSYPKESEVTVLNTLGEGLRNPHGIDCYDVGEDPETRRRCNRWHCWLDD